MTNVAGKAGVSEAMFKTFDHQLASDKWAEDNKITTEEFKAILTAKNILVFAHTAADKDKSGKLDAGEFHI
jgi:hypothetical protein